MKSFLKYNITAIFVFASCAAALALALFSQYVQGFHPCELCMWQRYALVAAAIFAAISCLKLKRLFVTASLLAVAANAAIAAYHFGIEQSWWQGFASCSSDFVATTIDELRAQILSAPAVRCDEATWFLLGLSMAGWSFLYSIGILLAVLAIKPLFPRK